MSPERAGSPLEEKAMTPKMSVPGSPVAGTPAREAQSSFALLLAVAQSQTNKTTDDDLTSLTWLQDKDLLKGMNFVSPSPSNSVQAIKRQQAHENILADQSPTSDYVDDSSISAADSSSSSLNSPVPQPPPINIMPLQRYRHPHTIPYDPMIHVTSKPPYSFSCLIFMAVEDSIQKALPVKEIYAWIMDHFPYFKTAPTGWKNSVRHNLSLNKCFRKVEKAPNLGKGSLWTVDQKFRPNLLQALTRSPYHPCSGLEQSDYYNNKTKQSADKTNASRLPNPELFPYLSNEMSRLVKSEDSDSLDAADAAAVMLSLRNGPKIRQTKKMNVVTSSPNQDHTYSAAANARMKLEEEEERLPKISRKIDFEDEEDRKIKEGAETLLNLAGYGVRKRSNSENYQPYRRMRLYKQEPEQPSQEYERTPQFRPRMLRKNRERLSNSNNNNIEFITGGNETEFDEAR